MTPTGTRQGQGSAGQAPGQAPGAGSPRRPAEASGLASSSGSAAETESGKRFRFDSLVVTLGTREVFLPDLGVLAAGIVLLIASFLDWFTFGLDFAVVAENAWGVGFLAYTGVELGLLAAVMVAMRAFAPDRLPLPVYRWQRITTGLATVGSVFILLKLAVGMDVLGTASENFDPAVGLWLGLAASLVLSVLCALAPVAGRHGAPTGDYR